MKKNITIFFTSIILFFAINITTTFANPTRSFTTGVYNARDTNLLIGSSLTARITPPDSKSIILVIDSDQTMQALVRLNQKVPKQILPPLDYDYSIIIFTNGTVLLS
ncbi:hypothetical protein CBE01nite_37210 [Clostridium beijerinckii]|uniref:Uncharacterized protein n=1 Tax=Clostridium beijerinckii TaxID=1520 RepID=A0AB74VA37_CLOBE|nr:hypothetical protein [Clostridium beijerinckii]NRZ27457.1 hypothetical protein [Clostridium beijerinckii]NYB96754.1 hypothetical protein [Clostridium beijerinckii]OOM22568.1 hypothetical protein CLBEI_31560 [Clostridium beijerinckii]QUN33291.1 hypothetical protein KEC93_14985 [Clostridium beijerinckii]SQB19936.1 Uncharacterised protein [Clostridium beijerinckii]